MHNQIMHYKNIFQAYFFSSLEKFILNFAGFFL